MIDVLWPTKTAWVVMRKEWYHDDDGLMYAYHSLTNDYVRIFAAESSGRTCAERFNAARFLYPSADEHDWQDQLIPDLWIAFEVPLEGSELSLG